MREPLNDRGSDQLHLSGGRARLGNKDGVPVVAKFANRLEDVGEGAMTAVLGRGIEVDAGDTTAERVP